MATVAPSSDQAADLLQNLSLDSQTKTLEVPEPTKKNTSYQCRAVDTGISANGQIQSLERSVTPFLPDLIDPALCYFPNSYHSPAFYYGSYNGTGNEWDDYSRYATADGVELTAGVFGDSGSVMYHNGYGYAPYGAYSPATSPVPTLGSDGQLYGPHHYQYPYFQPLNHSNGSVTPSQAATQGELPTDQKPSHDAAKTNYNRTANGGGVKGRKSSIPYKPAYQNLYGRGTFPGGVPVSGFQDGQYRSAGMNSFAKTNNVPFSKNPNFRHNTMGSHHPGPISGMGSTHSFVNRMYPNKFYGQYGNSFRSGVRLGPSGYDSSLNAFGWLAVDGKFKPRGQGNDYYGYHNNIIDGFNELNRGPRSKGFKNQKGFAPVTSAVKGQNGLRSDTIGVGKDEMSASPDWEQYNRADFSEDYPEAKFFIIKSYSEDDVHKSIKYNVWASTPNGNKKLDAAYQEAQQKSGGCPVFLFFSVNTSGQFVGLAEMVGAVNFDRNVEYWQQDKWTGCFPLKWHIVKDVPNNLLKHIILENNENKPVTNSRDTQEVKLEEGLKMIKIFKDHSSKTCILDDFGFYEMRQKLIQEKKAKQQQFHKQVLEAKSCNEKKDVAGELHKSLEVVSDMVNETTSTTLANGDLKHLENASIGKSKDASQPSKPVALEKAMANGIANGC